MCVVWITVTRNKLYWCHGYLLVQHADCRPDTKCRLGTKCCLQTAEWVQNADWESKEFFIWYGDIMSSCNLPSIMQSLFCNQLSQLFALLWNIPGPFFDENRLQHNFKPLQSLLTLHASWLLWCEYRFYQHNKSRCRCKWDVTIEYLTRKTFEKQLTALHVVRIIIFFKWYVFILLTKMWTKTRNMDKDQKCRPRPKLFLQLNIFLTFLDHITITYLRKSFIPDSKIK